MTENGATTNMTENGATTVERPITRESIIDYIRANEHRSNPGSFVKLAASYGQTPFVAGTSCRYAEDDGKPSCVIGNVLAVAGYDPSRFDNCRASLLFEDLNLGVELGGLAEAIQRFADRGYTWGTALRLALIQRGEEL